MPRRSTSSRAPALRRGAALALGLLLVLVAGACAERRADRLYGEAREKLEQGDVVEAVRLLDQILADYPSTDAADKAREEVDEYRDLAAMVARFPADGARDLMISAARAVEFYHERHGTYPRSLEELVAADLLPAPIDPWDRPLGYRARPGNRGYVLACYGADGNPGGEGDDADLFIESGEFVARPAGELP